MTKASNHWGIELEGADEDKNVWRTFLKSPFDPYVEEVQEDRGNYLTLRSTAFDEAASPKDARRLGETLIKTLNVAISKHTDADPVSVGAVIEFVSDGQPRKHRALKAESGEIRIRGGIAELKVLDYQGNVVEPPPTPSQIQLWMRAAKLDPRIACVLRYMEGNPGWVELYKAYEALKELPNGGIDKDEITRFRRTANSAGRHHPNEKKHPPHPKPMELWEGRAFITQWISAAIKDILEKNR
ncbi:hypothetical protein [Sneathiella sp.]|uniref:hypothetical protein n=1 Tax=Sneathiella sp. TaxID=1964365 RepID=UPI003564A34D